jgi:hypothetical protein
MPEYSKPFPRKGSYGPDMAPLPKMPQSGSGSNGADGFRKIPTNAETRSSGPKGGKMPSDGTSGGLPRNSY